MTTFDDTNESILHRPIVPSSSVSQARPYKRDVQTQTDKHANAESARTAKNEECLPVDQGDYINNYESVMDMMNE